MFCRKSGSLIISSDDIIRVSMEIGTETWSSLPIQRLLQSFIGNSVYFIKISFKFQNFCFILKLCSMFNELPSHARQVRKAVL